MHVIRIRLYPVKSLAGVDVEEAEVEPWGLRHDRRWVVFEPDGTRLTAREEHLMLAVTASPRDDGGIVLSADGSTLPVAPPVDGELVPVTVSRLDGVRAAGREADAWLSEALQRPVRLGWLDDPRRRPVSEAHGGRPGDLLSLADAGPLLLTAEASLRQLGDWAGQEFAMTRFRPSVVVDSAGEPFAEDGWDQVELGRVAFRFAEQCDRCVLTTIDPETRVQGKEPLRTLARHRRRDGKTWFGIRLIPLGTGTIRVGDRVVAQTATASTPVL